MILEGLGEAGSQAKEPPQQMALRDQGTTATDGLQAGAEEPPHQGKVVHGWCLLASRGAFGAWRA